MKTFNRRNGQRSAKIRGSVVNTVQILEQRVMLSAFTPGDIVVFQDGNGTTAMSGNTNPVFLDEYTPTGTLVQQIAMPTAVTGSNQPLTGGSGTGGGSGGLLTLSSDGSTLIVPGFDGATTNAITIGLVGTNGVVNTSNSYTGVAVGTVRGAASPDGTSTIYFSGGSGIFTGSLGGTAGQGATATNTGNGRGIELANGNVYVTSVATWRLGILAGGTIPNLPGITSSSLSSPYSFFFASDTSFDDTLYVADNSGAVKKFSLISGSWTSEGSTTVPSVTGLTGIQTSPTNVTLYAAGNSFATPGTSALYSLSDTLSPLGPTTMNSPTPTTLVNNSTAINELLNGVALVPQAAAGPSINLQPTGTSATSGTNATFSAFATGVPAPTIQWMVNQNDGSGYQPISGANAPTLTVPSVTASQNGYTYEAVFTNASGSKSSNPATLTVTTAPELFFDASTYTVNEGANNTATETITVDRLGSTASCQQRHDHDSQRFRSCRH